mmetsp:Transcript_108423/g.203502  ORF Transcript_108423/g.203502 Transcript_108423/m.203502 type:complete len:147 (+) Transcript_108423:58-498(+)
MPRRRDDSRSPSRRRRSPPRRSRRDSRSRSPPRRGNDRRDRDGKGGGENKNEKPGRPLPEWGTDGAIQELKVGGIGFIRPTKGRVDDKDLFFHKSSVKNGHFDDLAIGDAVTYEAALDESKNKPFARNVYLVYPKQRDDSRDRRRR